MVELSKFRDLVGIPFVDGGRDPKIGLDCWGLCMAVHRKLGREFPDFPIACNASLAIASTVSDEIKSRWKPVKYPSQGDLIGFSLDPELPEGVQHLGVYLGNGVVIHTLRKRNSHLIRLSDSFYAKKIRGFYSWIS